MQAIKQMNAIPAKAVSRTMHAIVRRQYGTPDVLKYEEIERPVPGDEDVLVRVLAAGASVGDHIIVTGKPYLIRLTPFGGIPRPRNLVPGACMAGRVEAVGTKVTTLRPGDEVFGEAVTGAFSEYLVVPANEGEISVDLDGRSAMRCCHSAVRSALPQSVPRSAKSWPQAADLSPTTVRPSSQMTKLS